MPQYVANVTLLRDGPKSNNPRARREKTLRIGVKECVRKQIRYRL